MRNSCEFDRHTWKQDGGWYCAGCGIEFPRVTFPKTIFISNMFGKHKQALILRGTVKPGDKITWPDGQVDEIVF